MRLQPILRLSATFMIPGPANTPRVHEEACYYGFMKKSLLLYHHITYQFSPYRPRFLSLRYDTRSNVLEMRMRRLGGIKMHMIHGINRGNMLARYTLFDPNDNRRSASGCSLVYTLLANQGAIDLQDGSLELNLQSLDGGSRKSGPCTPARRIARSPNPQLI